MALEIAERDEAGNLVAQYVTSAEGKRVDVIVRCMHVSSYFVMSYLVYLRSISLCLYCKSDSRDALVYYVFTVTDITSPPF